MRHPFTHESVSFALCCAFSLFPTIRDLCGALLIQRDPECHLAAVKMQSACFLAFTDYSDRMHVIDAFIAQIGNTMQVDTCNAALAELWHLVTRDTESVQPYQDQLHTIIDYLHSFTLEQVRVMSEILAAVAVQQVPDVDGAGVRISIHDKFRITTSKHLHSSVIAHHRIGTAFTIALLKQVGGSVVSYDDAEAHLIPRGSNSMSLFESIWSEFNQSITSMNTIQAETCRMTLFDQIATAIEAGAIHRDMLPYAQRETEIIHKYIQPFHIQPTLPDSVDTELVPGM